MPLPPPAESELDHAKVMIIADHIGAADYGRTDTGWRFKCPECGAWDFWTANSTLVQAVTLWLAGGRLPGGVLLGGVCMSCEHVTNPRPRDVEPD